MEAVKAQVESAIKICCGLVCGGGIAEIE